ncbi:hypothetical protein [Myxococcus sp. CA005]|nr:hypothetical protein [Myxococcus sp. CA005]
MAVAEKNVLEDKFPVTGVRALTSAPAHWVTSPLAMTANLPEVQRFLLGETAPQRLLQSREATLAKLLRTPYEAEARALLPQSERPALATEEQKHQHALAEVLGRPIQ